MQCKNVAGTSKVSGSSHTEKVIGYTFERNGDVLRVCAVHSLDEKTLRSDWSIGEEIITLPESWELSISKASALPQVRLGSVCFKTLLFHEGATYQERLAVADRGSLMPLDIRYMEFFYRNQQLVPGKIKGSILFPGIDIISPQGYRSVPCLTREKEWWVKRAVCVDKVYISDDDAFALTRNIKTPAFF